MHNLCNWIVTIIHIYMLILKSQVTLVEYYKVYQKVYSWKILAKLTSA